MATPRQNLIAHMRHARDVERSGGYETALVQRIRALSFYSAQSELTCEEKDRADGAQYRAVRRFTRKWAGAHKSVRRAQEAIAAELARLIADSAIRSGRM